MAAAALLLCVLPAYPQHNGEREAYTPPAELDSLPEARDDMRQTAWATRTGRPPLVDGYPEDSCWTNALALRDFVQRRPDEGAEPTEETVVRIVYDDESIYFLFICYDSEPDGIIARMTPRDQISSSDNVRIYIDSFYDRRTAFQFAVNAVNVQEDVLWTEDTRRDESWNAVWYSQVRQLDYGWVAEIEIPFSVLRFGGGGQFRTWGLNLTRYIQRKREYLQWQLIGEEEDGFFVSRFGMLGGLESIEPPYRLEFLPYVTGQLQDNEVLSNDVTSNYGLDLKYGPSPEVNLDLTVNPEFGTVETDEEQLNLSPFPTYYPEKRPFFIEFQDIFRTDMRLVHTRRIGKPLSNVVNPTATILTGARAVGKTANGVRYGIIEALADEENFYYRDLDNDDEFDSGDEQPYRKLDEIPMEQRDSVTERYLEPRSNYLVGRVLSEFADGSSIGLIGTAVNRDRSHEKFEGNPYAYAGGMDWDLRFNHTWMFAGQVAGSSVEDEEGDKAEGYGVELKLRKFNGRHITYGVNYDVYSDDLNVNDLGWIYGNDYGTHRMRSFFNYRARPHSRGIRSYNINWSLDRDWTNKGLSELYGMTYGNRDNMGLGTYSGESMIETDGSMSGWLQFMNYWSVYFGIHRALDNDEDAFRAVDDYDFIFRYPRGGYYWWGLSNDYSSMLNFSVNHGLGSFRDGDRWRGSVRFRLRPSPNLEFEFEPSIDKRTGFSEFSDVTGGQPEAPDAVLTLRDTRFQSYVMRTSYTMNNKIDFRLFAQYTDFESSRYSPLESGFFTIDEPFDASSTLGVHFVTRFEYKPGSYFYLVYRESRRDADEGGGFGRPDRQLIGKFTYWFKQS